MDQGPAWSRASWGAVVVVGAYLGFALCAGLSVRADGSTRWPALVVGAVLMAAAVCGSVAGLRTRR